jgi:hypothetical protein
MKKTVIILITLLILSGCELLISENPQSRENPNDPYWNPYSVFNQSLAEDSSIAYGKSVSRSGDYIIVGSPGSTVGGLTEAGQAFVYHLENGSWNLVETLQAPTPAADMAFGSSVAIDGSTIAVGADQEDHSSYDYAGAVYIFNKGSGTDWTFEERLAASPDEDNEMFGHRIVLDVPYLIVSAHQDTSNQGTVHLYKFQMDGYASIGTLTNDVGVDGARFGGAMDYSDPWLIVGSHRDTVSQQGSARIFEREGDDFIPRAKILSSQPESNGWFGIGVSIDSYGAVVGSLETVDSNAQAGRVYYFERDSTTGWSTAPAQVLESLSPASPGYFGVGLGLSDGVLLISAPGEGQDNSGIASAYTLSNGTWEYSHGYNESSTVRYGWSVFLDSEYLLIGDNADEGSGGEVYIYSTNE